MVAEMPQTIGVLFLLQWMILLIASSVCTPRLEPNSSCHSSTTNRSRCAKSCSCDFPERRRCRLSGVMIKTSGSLFFCFCRSALLVSPFLILTVQGIPISTVASSMALPMSLASARSGVTQSSLNPLCLSECQSWGCVSMNFRTAPINTEKVFPQPVGALTNPLLCSRMAFQVSNWY